MGERIAQKANMMAYYIMSCLFFFGNIKFIKMVLTYLGVTTGITIIASAIFAILEAVVLYCFLYRVVSQKKWGMLALVIVINVIYGMPYVITGMIYELIQFCVFMAPFTVAAYLIIFDENGISRFFAAMANISRFGVWVFLAYIVVLFVSEPGEYGLVEIKEMSYGDIAYAALPFLLTDLEVYFIEENRKKRIFAGFRVLVYLSVLIYTGTRSAMVCMGAIFALQLLRNFRNILKMGTRRIAAALCSVVLCLGFCLMVIPAGARLNVIRGHLLHELMGNNIGSIFDNLPESSEPIVTETQPTEPEVVPEPGFVPDFSSYPLSYVYNVSVGQYVDISEAFEYYILNSNNTISQTEEVLQRDIINQTGQYMVVNPGYIAEAVEYHLPINSRVYLWSTAWNEFRSAPLTGHGALYYQQKYEGYFPHNVILEIMVDHGLVGMLLIGALVLFTYFYAIILAVKTSDRLLGELLALITAYVPMHLLYHSLYSNGIFIFTVCVLLFIVINKKMRKQKPDLDR